MNESISFPEVKIPEVIRIIRQGIRNCPNVSQETKEQLEKQCKQLESYWLGR